MYWLLYLLIWLIYIHTMKLYEITQFCVCVCVYIYVYYFYILFVDQGKILL